MSKSYSDAQSSLVLLSLIFIITPCCLLLMNFFFFLTQNLFVFSFSLLNYSLSFERFLFWLVPDSNLNEFSMSDGDQSTSRPVDCSNLFLKFPAPNWPRAQNLPNDHQPTRISRNEVCSRWANSQ